MKEYVLGVDGGGTKTDYLLFDTEGNQIAFLRGGGMNHEGMPGGMAELETRLNEVLLSFLVGNGLKPRDLAASVFGMAGVDVPSQKAAIESILMRMGLRNVRVMNDAFIGIRAGSRKGYGICAVNGTGNTIGGIDRAGKWLQVAGTGYVSGEEGGAYRIAEHTFRAVYEELFCMGMSTSLTGPVMQLLHVSDPEDFIDGIYSQYRTGAVSPKDVLDILFDCGNRGDEAAVGILKRVGSQIARCIAGCERRLDFGDEIDVVLVGSVTLKAACPIMRDTLMSETLRITGKKVNFIPLAVPVALGAILWATELATGRQAGEEIRGKITEAMEQPTPRQRGERSDEWI